MTKRTKFFVLLKGEFVLFIGTGDSQLEDVYAVKLEPFKMYNVKKGTWHSHTLSTDASVLIVENSDTQDDNSPMIDIDNKLKQKMLLQTNRLLNL